MIKSESGSWTTTRVGSVLRRKSSVLDGAGTVVRLGLAAVWLIAGAGKVADPGTFAMSVKTYQVFPDDVASVVAAIVPLLEVAFGLLLLFGVGSRLLGVLSGLLLAVYIAGIVQAWACGLSIDCGCFSRGGQVAAGETQYPWDILRDTGFLLLAAWLTIRPRTCLSIDGRLASRQQPAAPAADAAVEKNVLTGSFSDSDSGPASPTAEKGQS
jgi:uncharacterized membrane protein YphA (DoxX/SURF4 family)